MGGEQVYSDPNWLSGDRLSRNLRLLMRRELLRLVKEERAKQAERDKEDARLAREKGWCDDSLSDKTAAEIYREKSCPWRGKPDPIGI